MTDKEKYDFIDHVVHLTLVEENRLLNEHGGEYSRLKEDGIDSNEYYRIITERVINILKKNNKYMQEEPVSEDFEKALANEWKGYIDRGAATVDALEDNTQELAFAKGFYRGAKWKEQKDSIISDDLEEAAIEAFKQIVDSDKNSFLEIFKAGTKWKEQQMMSKAIDGKVIANGMGNPILHLWNKGKHLIDKKVKVIVVKEE